MSVPPDGSDVHATLARVAVVEDDIELRERVLVPGLCDFGFATEGFASAAGLYRAMLAAPFDLVVLDIGLPDEDGFAIARHLREVAAMRVGIVILSGRGGTADRVRGLDEGSDAYLAKPVDIEVLAATLHSLLRRMRASSDTPAPGGWHLDANGWCLRSPRGARVALTQPERSVLARLIDSGGDAVSRDALIGELTDDVIAFDPHRLDMLFHRLRRKIEDRTGEAAPIRAARGIGYAFAP